MSLSFLRRRRPEPWSVWLAPLSILKPHEEVDLQHFERLFEEILRDGILKVPLLVDYSTLVILDGHHRFKVLSAIEAERAPVFLVDYRSDKVLVGSWRRNVKVSKEIVLEAGLKGRKLPYKTSRHILVDVKIPRVNIPLELLRRCWSRW